ncbi:hypothetical protein C2845_PM17G05020 [Panicum miliaceum]|uniref:WAT1-related protein n=1 Tax=Panicum miliaceum TaxID=4540 RepID=A0A3L6Q3H0_PANMI|nr:hypothetical protein C2845_PM17G05020 [Panicum miliaceum]
MEEKKPYVSAIIVQVIYTGMSSSARQPLTRGSTPVFIFYRQAASSLLLLPVAVFLERKNAPSISFSMILKLFFYAFIGSTFSLNLYNVSMKLTSATVASATFNSQPVVTFCLALLLRMEVVKLRSSSGIAKVTGVSLCLAGVLVIALYIRPGLSPINHHRVLAPHVLRAPSRVIWIKGTFLMVLANMSWSLWIVKQAAVLKEYPNKILMKLSQCIFSTVQSFIVAVVAERDFSKWKLRLDISLLTIIYTGFIVNGVSFCLQAWCVELKGPVFLTVWTPFCLILTIFCSSILGEIVHLGSYAEEQVPSNKVNTMDIGMQDEQEHEQREEDNKGREEQKEATSAFMVEQV